MVEAAVISKPGPKSQRDLSPLPLKSAPKRGYKRVYWFANKYLKVPAGHGQGKAFKLRTWQKEITQGCFPEENRPSQGLVSMPRGNGKSSLAAVFALYGLFADGVESPQVLIMASDVRQAGIIFNACRRMIELSPELEKRTKVYKDRIEVPGNNGLLMPLPADVGAAQGWAPTLALVDELHVVNADLWEAMLLSSGKRPDSLCLAISTPADNDESVMWQLVSQARSEPDPDFYFKEYTSDPSHPTDCLHCITESNPAYGDFLSAKSMANVRRTSRESSYRRLRLGQWLDAVEDSWVSRTTLDAVLTPSQIKPGSKVVLAVDGSYSGDTTAIVAVTVEATPRAQLLRLWNPKDEADEGYRVPILDVEQAIRDAAKTYDVAEICFDPYRFARTMQELGRERLPVVEFPQSAARMTPATVSAFEAIVNRTIEIHNDENLTKHILNCRVTEDSRGTRLRKDKKDSPNKIDSAVCMVMALSRASFLASKPKRAKVFRSVA
ncbi:phage terminase family protein [Dermacoccus abyssi]|uniref:phage terminase family protein n=1 Tax=Dermacoccus abyssi TaxID=322596 RepID=UPI0021A516DD|nr:phage terminase family protein [Dermacoccus abyssi]MCT1986877.1 phage terminase family protein [Dermacoccus abyssi]